MVFLYLHFLIFLKKYDYEIYEKLIKIIDPNKKKQKSVN